MLKLIHVGNSYIDTSSRLYVIPCYFQPWSEEENHPLSNSILTRVVDSSIAGELICGSLWADSGTPCVHSVNTSSESQIFWAGTDLKSSFLLKDLVNPSALTPSTFWLDQGDTWVICIDLKNKKVIVPYFELLRVLFYKVSRRLTQFFFSFLPLNLLCRILRHPIKENNLTTEFCVASTELSPNEAILISNILCNTALRKIFNLSQANHIDISQHNKQIHTNKSSIKEIGTTENNILFKSNGYNFTHNHNPYFWVESLEIININYDFQRIIFYPISESKTNLLNSSKLPACSNLFRHVKQLNSERHEYALENKKMEKIFSTDLENARNHASFKNHSNILIMRGIPWAESLPDKKKFYWLDDRIMAKVLFHHSRYRRNNLSYSQKFYNILLSFKTAGHNVTFLSLNNLENVFGGHASIFPVNGQPPLPGSIHKNLIHSFTIAKIQFSNTVFFLAQPFPDNYPNFIILCQKLNLNSPSQTEWNELFSRVIPVYDYNTFYKFSKRVTPLARANSSYNIGLIAIPIPIEEITVELCIKFTDHVVNVFRKRMQIQVILSLKFPNGINEDEYKTINKSVANSCRVPNSKWITVISLYWS